MQRRSGAQHLADQGGAPAVASGHQRVARGRAHGRSGERIGEAPALFGETIEVWRAHQFGIRAVAAQAAPAEVIAENDDHVGSIRRRGELEQAEQKKGKSFHGAPWNAVLPRDLQGEFTGVCLLWQFRSVMTQVMIAAAELIDSLGEDDWSMESLAALADERDAMLENGSIRTMTYDQFLSGLKFSSEAA